MEKATRSMTWMRRRTIGCGCGIDPTQVAGVRADKKGAEDRPWMPAPGLASGRVIHLELDRVRRHAEALHLLVLERDVRIDHVVGEDPAAGEELAVLVERLERLV